MASPERTYFMNTLGRIFTMTLVPLVLLSGAACANEQDGSNPGGPKAADPASISPETPTPSNREAPSDGGGAEKSVKVIDTDFRPVALVVSAGTTVTWKQIGDQPHSVSSNDEVFESSPKCSPTASDMCLGEGDVFTFTFEEVGTFKYYCRVHGLPDGTGMTGTVVVE